MSEPYSFIVSGQFDIDQQLTPEINFDGKIIGFRLPDGRRARLIVGIELATNTEIFEDVTSQADMEILGFNLQDYHQTHFIKES